jgi:cholesterol transport system auxiliary component
MSVKSLVPAVMAVVLAGCGGLKSSAPAEQLYVLRPPQFAAPTTPRVEATLLVRRPQVQPGLDTARIAVLEPGHRLDYVAGASWSAPLGAVAGSLFTQSLKGSGRFAQVSDDASGVSADFVLAITLRRFEADYQVSGATPTVQLELECALISPHEHRQVASFDIATSAAAAANRQESIVAAFEQAAQAASVQLVERSAAFAAQSLAAPAPGGH